MAGVGLERAALAKASLRTPAMPATNAQLREAQVAMPEGLAPAIALVRDNASKTNWCLIGYEADGLALKMIGTGEGGTAELAANLADDNICYGLVRTSEAVDKTDNVKFIFVSFIGEGVKPMRRAKVSTFKGTIAESFAPYHIELLNATSKSEVTDQAITELLGSMFGQAVSRPHGASQEMRLPGGRTVKVTEGAAKSDRGAMAEKQVVVLPDGLAPAIAAVRDNASPVDWCLCGYEAEPGLGIVMVGSGEGGTAALAAKLADDNIYYGLVRTTEQIDKSTTVKFVFVSFIGEGVKPMRKAKISTLKGTVTEAFEPFHAELLNATSAAEVTPEAITEMLKRTDGAVGTAQATPRREQEVRVTKTMGGGGAGGVLASAPREEEPVAEEVAAAIAAVRSDADPTTWVCLGYSDGKAPSLTLVAKGEGAAEAMQPHLDKAQVMHGLVRVSQQVDRSTTVKFAALSWLGDEVPPLRKAKLSSMRGAADKVLSPVHAELLNVSEAASVSHQAIMERLEGINLD